MGILSSVGVVATFFAGFLSLGTAGSMAGDCLPSMHVVTDASAANTDFVHDKETIRLYLLYHNPARGAIPAVPSAGTRNPTISI